MIEWFIFLLSFGVAGYSLFNWWLYERTRKLNKTFKEAFEGGKKLDE